MSAANNCDRLLLDWLSSNSLSTIAGDLAKNGIATLRQLKETPDVDALVDRLKMHSFYANKFKKAFEGIPRGISASPSSNNDDNADGAKKKVPGKLNVERRKMSINLSALKPGALPTYKKKRQNEAEKQAKKELIEEEEKQRAQDLESKRRIDEMKHAIEQKDKDLRLEKARREAAEQQLKQTEREQEEQRRQTQKLEREQARQKALDQQSVESERRRREQEKEQRRVQQTQQLEREQERQKALYQQSVERERRRREQEKQEQEQREQRIQAKAQQLMRERRAFEREQEELREKARQKALEQQLEEEQERNFVGWDVSGRELYANGGDIKKPFYYMDGEGKHALRDKTSWSKNKTGRQLYHGPEGGIYYNYRSDGKVKKRYLAYR